jgi:predicted permease
MERLGEVWRRLMFLFRRRQFDRDLEEEMRFHLDMKAMDEGLDRARRSFGNMTLLRETSHEAWGWKRLEELARDVRYGLRQFGRSPGFTAAAVLTLALGLGANTAIFTVLYSVVLKPLPYSDPGGIVKVYLTIDAHQGRGERTIGFSYPKFEELRRIDTLFASMAGYALRSSTLTAPAPADRISSEFVSRAYFRILGVPAALGRTFLDEEDATAGAHAAAVIGDGLWRERFGADPAAIGKTIRLDDIPFTIVGVAPKGFKGDSGHADLWVPLATAGQGSMKNRREHWFEVIARLKPGVTPSQASAEVKAVMRSLERLQPSGGANSVWDAGAMPLAESKLDRKLARGLVILYAAVGFVLLIACANLANLTMARLAGRQREIALRVALGAGRGSLVRQFLVENVMLALGGGAAGLLLAMWGMKLLERLRPVESDYGGWPSYLRAIDPESLRMTAPVLAFAVALSVLAGLLFGLAPALRAARGDAGEVLKGGALWRPARHRLANLRGVLLAGQMALVVVLLAGAGLTIRGFARLVQTPLGIRAENVLTFRVDLPRRKYQGKAAMQNMDRLLARFGNLPGVEAAVASEDLPVRTRSTVTPVQVESGPQNQYIGLHYVGPGFFRVFRIPMRAGRTFTERDRDGSQVAILSERAARLLFPAENPIGRHIHVNLGEDCEVVGVVAEVQYGNQAQQLAIVGDAFRPPRSGGGYVALRVAGNPKGLIPAVRRIVAELEPEAPVFDARTMEEHVFAANSSARFSTVLLGMFAGLALALAVVGIYGVFSYAVAARTREFGIRIASGARARDILKLVIGDGAVLCAAGLAAGLPAALAATRTLGSLLYDVKPGDRATYLAASAVLVATALAACLFPALRATKIDPVVALRCE